MPAGGGLARGGCSHIVDGQDAVAVNIDIQDEIGTDFVGYRIEALIGRGGMGVVYRAYDLRLKRTVALKLVAPELALDERFRARFARESELAMSLEHPNVVPVYDAGDVDGRIYLAMRHVDGTDLRALLRREGTLEPARAIAIAGQVGNALDAAHARGLVHRDVKPSNVLLDKDEHVYLADLGLSRRLEEQGPHAGDDRSVGTPAYLAPEQIEGGPVDARVDVYSLGCLLYECLTGRRPFAGDSRLAVAWAHLEEDPPSASEQNPDLPEAIDPVIREAMAKAPEDRYATCGALIAEAEAALGLREPPTLRRRRLLLLAAAVTVVLLTAAVVAALIVRGARDATEPIVRPNTLVRIDPASNAISDVIDVGSMPSATAVGGRSVWVYNDLGRTLTEVDAGSDAVRQQVRLTATPAYAYHLLGGPVLDADQAGAWLVGVDRRGAGYLTRILSRRGGKQDYHLDVEPKAVAVWEDAVWVLGHGNRGDELRRIDAASGKVTARTRFPASVQIDSLTVGLGGVWAVDSSSATLYRVDPRSATLSGHVDLGERPAGRPGVKYGNIWVGVSDETVVVEPRNLHVLAHLPCCPVEETGSSAIGYGSTWGLHWPTGEVVRWSSTTAQLVASVRLADSPFWGGPCLTSIAAGARAVWVTVGPSRGSTCSNVVGGG
jgi:Protein kinase domain